MPLYEYKCGFCGKTFEVIQKFSDPPLKLHDACGGPVERVISPPSLRFKGSGWYVTDYGSGNGKGKPAESKKETKATSDSAAKPDAKGSSTTPAGTSDKKA